MFHSLTTALSCKENGGTRYIQFEIQFLKNSQFKASTSYFFYALSYYLLTNKQKKVERWCSMNEGEQVAKDFC